MSRNRKHNPLQRVLCFEPFAAVPVSVARNAELSPSARALYGLISSYSSPVDGERRAQVARATLAQRLGRCVRTVVRLASELFEHGLVEIVRGSGRTSSIYTLCQFGSLDETAIENAAVTQNGPGAATPAYPIPESYKPESAEAAAVLGFGIEKKAKRQDSQNETPLADLFGQTSTWSRRDRQKLDVSLKSKGATPAELKSVLAWLEGIERNDFMERVRRQPHLLASQWRSIRDQWDADRCVAAASPAAAAVAVSVEWVKEWLETRIREGYTIQAAQNMIAGEAQRVVASDLVRDPDYRERLEALATAQRDGDGLRGWARKLARQIGIGL